MGKDYEPLSRISDAFVTPDQLSRHYKSCFMEGGSIPLVRTSLLSTLSSGLQTPARNSRLSPPTRPKMDISLFFFYKMGLFDDLERF